MSAWKLRQRAIIVTNEEGCMQLFNILKLIVVSLFVYLAIIQNGWAGLEDRKGIVEFQIRVINVTAFSGTIR